MGGLSRPAALIAALAGSAVAVGGGACRERAQAVQSEAELRDMVRRMMPVVSKAAGLPFKRAPMVARRTRGQVRDYIIHKFDQDLPPHELEGLQSALRCFGFIPDTLALRRMMIDLLTEQIAGYYDPDSNALYIPADIEPFQLRVVVSHELGHALQDQYLRLDSILTQHGRNDRRAAAQAILEGQATVTQIPVLMPEQKPESLPLGWFWQQRVVAQRQQAQMAQFAHAPLWVREGLIFPYLGGADFVLWFRKSYPGRSVLSAMPTSTEQILHPERYAEHDEPTELAFQGPAPDTVRYEDGLGEFETRLLFQQQLGNENEAATFAMGWDGDRYQVLGREAEALVWYSVWDDVGAADRFARGLERAWGKRTAGRKGGRAEVKRLTIEGRPAVRLVDAPANWKGWRALPAIRIAGG
jgi:hypothetical protein